MKGMVIDMNEAKLVRIEQVRAFLEGTGDVSFTMPATENARYAHIETVLLRLGYRTLKRADKGVVRRYLMRTTGYSRQTITRLIARWSAGAVLERRYHAPSQGFARRYTAQDVSLLAETDALHQTLSGPATRHLMARMLNEYGDTRYARLATISNGQIYNLRKKASYLAQRQHFTKTRKTTVPIGERRAPAPDGRPGFIRIDSVHQGDLDGVKGVYHINAVDCVTQWELVASCERISEAYLLPVIESLLAAFPFKIMGFHADNGSEYINKRVAKLLDKLNAEFTKSRPRHSNDNGLAESKNAAIVRKHLGYSHLPQRFARQVNALWQEHLNPYVNFHRPCLFAVETTNAKGKTVKRYPQNKVATPFEKLCSMPDTAQYLKPGVTLSALAEEAHQMSDNEAARRYLEARRRLFLSIDKRPHQAA